MIDKERVPLDEDIDEYFKREVLPYNPEAYINKEETVLFNRTESWR